MYDDYRHDTDLYATTHCLSVCLFVTSRDCIEAAERMEHVFSRQIGFHRLILPYVGTEFDLSPENKRKVYFARKLRSKL